MEISKFLLAGLVLISCAVIFQLIGLASPYWITFNVGSLVEVYMGLWKYCTEIIQLKVSTCQDSTENISEGWFSSVKAMTILGLLALLVALGMTIMKMFVLKDSKVALFVAVGTAFAGAVFILISIAVFAVKVNDQLEGLEFSYHFGFAFCILAMLAGIGAGCLMLVDAIQA
ncbi:epithelial membrane protein 1-like [Crassostrea virginica]